MPAREVGLPAELPAELAAGLAAIRTELEVPEEFPADVVAAAEQAAASPRLPDLDRTDLDFVTIDPEGSRDLDQAVHIARDGSGFVISYAIADVAAFVTAGDPVDLEAHRRGMTLYAPNRRTPLHPPALSEGAASLLPDQVRPALLWTIRVNERARMTGAEVNRALVRSRAQLSYVEAQAEIDSGTPRETLALLSLVGRWRERREVERGGVSLQTPEQEVVADDSGWRLVFRAPLPVEGWNAQISLLTGMAAAHLMLYGQIGVLRTMPPADPGALRRLRQTARALSIRWPAELDYPDFVRSLDPEQPREAAMLNACTALFRGAGYKAFSGGLPEEAEHAALANDYSHVTAPLRRLVDRYAGEVCVALCEDRPVPEWVRQRLDGLPEEMAAAERRAKRYERAVIDLVEAFLLQHRVGEVFPGTVVEVDRERDRGTVVVPEPAISAKVNGSHLPLGEQVAVRLANADPTKGVVAFELA
ncbi:MAG TPA: RNB domain-containing ribonuclease [Propionibacteriaceae bacterium]|nr:RNB domain-containing ribonuclease [Propionibacteriaceae bacterium]